VIDEFSLLNILTDWIRFRVQLWADPLPSSHFLFRSFAQSELTLPLPLDEMAAGKRKEQAEVGDNHDSISEQFNPFYFLPAPSKTCTTSDMFGI